MLRAFGAEIVLTPGADGMRGAVDKAQEIVDTTENAVLASQFTNEANPQIHYDTTGPEIWEDTDGEVDWLLDHVELDPTVVGPVTRLLADVVVADDLAAGRLVELLPETPPLPVEFGVLTPHREFLDPKVRLFVDFAVKALKGAVA